MAMRPPGRDVEARGYLGQKWGKGSPGKLAVNRHYLPGISHEQPSLGPCCSDIEQTPFLFPLLTGQRLGNREFTLCQADNKYCVPFQSLGRMDSGKYQAVRSICNNNRIRWFQGGIINKCCQGIVAGNNCFKLFNITASFRVIVVIYPFKGGLVVLAENLKLFNRCQSRILDYLQYRSKLNQTFAPPGRSRIFCQGCKRVFC